mmetsp:Transcript_4873/g.10750  ORF Transcript_4873/g.10750 Transcript_4873/m.10750 type:complete len:420 (-) Transcript_4873:2195-3454(-)
MKDLNRVTKKTLTKPKLKMSAAVARRRKQLLARKKQQEAAAAAGNDALDPVSAQLQKLLEDPEKLSEESIAYEALQLAQSQIRKKVHAGSYAEAIELACSASLTILEQGRVSVASQLTSLLANVLRETHTVESPALLEKLKSLHNAQEKAMDGVTGAEAVRLNRLERDWLRKCLQWSSELGKTRYGDLELQKLLAQQSWKLSQQLVAEGADENVDEEDNEVMELKTDAVTHMALAEEPLGIVEWLKTLPKPTAAETKTGHSCPPADRDTLLTRAVLCFCAIENLRDASTLCREFLEKVEDRDAESLTASYVSKDDGKAPSHIIFCCMLIRTCEKDRRTGPLFSWLLRSFKRELDGFYKVQIIQSYTSKIGKIYFNIQPPPSMMNMLENMMGSMGGGAGMGGLGGINPAMMQAMMQNMQM